MKCRIYIYSAMLISSIVLLCGCGEKDVTSNNIEQDSQITLEENSTFETVEATPTPTAEEKTAITDEEKTKYIQSSVKKLHSVHDDFSDKYIYDSSKDCDYYRYNLDNSNIEKRTKNPFQIYLCRTGADFFFYVNLAYSGDKWIDFDKCEIKVNDSFYTIDLKSYEKHHDVNGSTAYENYYLTIEKNSELYKAIMDIVEYQQGTLRYSGDKTFTWQLTEDSIQAITEMMNVYDTLDYLTEHYK